MRDQEEPRAARGGLSPPQGVQTRAASSAMPSRWTSHPITTSSHHPPRPSSSSFPHTTRTPYSASAGDRPAPARRAAPARPRAPPPPLPAASEDVHHIVRQRPEQDEGRELRHEVPEHQVLPRREILLPLVPRVLQQQQRHLRRRPGRAGGPGRSAGASAAVAAPPIPPATGDSRVGSETVPRPLPRTDPEASGGSSMPRGAGRGARGAGGLTSAITAK